MIKAGDLPGGWRNSNHPTGDFRRLSFCGVDTKPAPAVRAGVWRWSQGGLGPFLDQHVRVYRDDQAEAIISALGAALPTCTKAEVPKDDTNPEKATLEVEPITVTAEIVFTRRGRTLVVFTSHRFDSTLDRNVLVRAVAALQAKPQS